MRRSTWAAAVIIACSAATQTPAQQSNAARYILQQEVQAACGTVMGVSVDPRLLREPDLNGDGRGDYIFAHEWVRCPNGQSGFCGVVCDVKIYIREGELLVEKDHFLSRGVELIDGNPPRLRSCGAQGQCDTSPLNY